MVEKSEYKQRFAERVNAARDRSAAQTLEEQESLGTLEQLFAAREAKVREFYKDKKTPDELEKVVKEEKQKYGAQLTHAWNSGVENSKSTSLKVDQDTVIHTFKGIIGGQGLTGALTGFVMSLPVVGELIGAVGTTIGTFISSFFDKSVKPIGFPTALNEIRDAKMRVGGVQGLIDQKLVSGDEAQALLAEMKNDQAPATVRTAAATTPNDPAATLLGHVPAPVVMEGSKVADLPAGTNVAPNLGVGAGRSQGAQV
jgi:hypothetical protein